MKLAWWEYDELLEHLQDRPDIWTHDPEVNPFLWLRQDRPWSEAEPVAQEPAVGLNFLPPGSPDSPYRMYGVQILPLSWAEADCEAYVSRLIGSWTSYGLRIGREALLRDCRIAEEEVPLIALALGVLDHADGPVGPPVGSDEPVADALAPILPAPKDPLEIGTYLLSEGGYVRLRLAGGQIQTRLSIPSKGKRGLRSFGPVLEGYVRPIDGRIRDTAVFLAGEDSIPSAGEERRNQVSLW